MKKKLLSLFASLLFFSSAWSQCVPTCSAYAVSPITFTTFPVGQTNVTPSFTNTFLGTWPDDGSYGPVPIGFNFDFFCNTYTGIHICSNGFIMLDYMAFPWPTQYVHPTQSLPNSTVPNGMISFNMTDLDPGVGGTITYTTVGTPPNRMFVVTYSDVPCFTTHSDVNTGQIVLYETTNIIEIYTTKARPDVNQINGATQGIENTSGTVGFTPPGRNANGSWGSGSDGTAYQFAPYTPAPPTSITGSTLVCQGTANSYQATFMPGASSYGWGLPGAWTGTSTVSSINTGAGASGNLSVTATYTCGTSAPTTLSVNVIPSPVVSIVSASPNIICSGSVVNFSTSGAATYTLNPIGLVGTPPFTDTPQSTTTYTLFGTDSTGCVSKNDPTVLITVNPTPTVTVNDGTVCLGHAFQMIPQGAITYTFSNQFSQVTPTVAGMYSYTITGKATNGCKSQAVSSLTVFALPTLTATPSRTAMCPKESVSLTVIGASTYTWNVNNQTANTITVSPLATTIYSVTGTDSRGCVNGGTVNVLVKNCTGINEFNQAQSIAKIYPNPSQGVFVLECSSIADKSSFELYNSLGQILITQKINSENTDINIKQYSGGVYYLKVKSDGREEIIKVIKE
jgi:hypothetical protein